MFSVRLNLAMPLLLIVVAASVVAQQPATPDAAQWELPSNNQIRSLLAERMARNGVGLVVGVIDRSGRRVIVHGLSGAADRRPLDGDTVFQIGSVTKVFTGLLLADMAQRGEVRVDDPAGMYLPAGVTMPEKGRPITLIDLSKHWSGLPSMPGNFTLDARPNPYEAYSVDQLYAFVSGYALPREPGRQEYSNLGVALLGRLLGRRAGLEYEDLLRQRVLVPLNLRSTSITLSADQLRRLAPGHDRFLQPVDTWNLLSMPASGSLRSTANDLLTFLSYNLDLQDTSLAMAMAMQRVPGRALGWARSQLGGETVYGHDGGKEGYRSAVVFNPRMQTGVVVLANARTDDRPMDLARHLLFRGSPLAPAPAAPSRPMIVPLDLKQLDAHAGVYRLESGGLLKVVRRDDHLLLDLGGGIVTLFPSAEHRFFANTEDIEVEFANQNAGRITGLTLQRDGTQQSAAKQE